MKNKFLENATKLDDGRYRFRESRSIRKEDYKKISLTENQKVIESNGKDYPVTSAYTFKIWEIDKFNFNGRCYSKVVPIVLKEQPITLGAMNHPEDEMDMTKVCAVEKNPRIKDGWLIVDSYLVGDYGRLVEEILDKGGPIEVSSSALGSIDNNGYVLEEGFCLERYFDIVFGASNGFKHFKEYTENVVFTEDKKTPEKTNRKKESIIDGINKKGEIKKMTIEERSFSLSMSRLIKEYSQIENLKERLDEFKNLLEWCDKDNPHFNDIKETIESNISELEIKVKELTEKGVKTDSLEKDIESLNDNINEVTSERDDLINKYKVALDKIEEGKELYNKLKEMYELAQAKNNTFIDPEEYKELIEKIEELQTDNKKLSEKLKEVSKEKAILERKVDSYREAKKKEIALQEKKRESIKKLEEKKKKEDELKNKIEEKKNDVFKAKEDLRYSVENIKFEQDPEIYEMYTDWVNDNPKVALLKEKILECKTIRQAQAVYFQNKDIYEDEDISPYDIKLNEFYESIRGEDDEFLGSSKGNQFNESKEDEKEFNLPKGFQW
jgi:hypothetical protein